MNLSVISLIGGAFILSALLWLVAYITNQVRLLLVITICVLVVMTILCYYTMTNVQINGIETITNRIPT